MARGQSPINKLLRGRVAELAVNPKLTAAAALDALAADADRLDVDLEDFPEERTVARWLKDIRSSDTSDPWVPMAADGGQAARVLPVLGEVVATFGEQRWLSQNLAALVDRVVLAAPTVPRLWALGCARGYGWAREHKCNTRGLDLTLALMPWESREAATTWANLLWEMGDQAGGWPGGGPGLMAAVAGWPLPNWAESEESFSALLWRILTLGIEEATGVPFKDTDEHTADSKVTAKPVDGGGPTETDAGENPRHHEESGPE